MSIIIDEVSLLALYCGHRKGLGKEGQGRVEPVEIIILPAGKSLDVCAELREAKKVRMVDGVEVVKRRKKKRRKKCGKASSTQDKTGDMFQFLNTKVFSRGTSESGRFQLEKEEKAPPSGNAGNLNVQVCVISSLHSVLLCHCNSSLRSRRKSRQ